MSLNEREKVVNERGGKEDKRRKKTFERGTFGLYGGESIIFHIGDCIGHLYFWEIRRLYYWFLAGEACCRNVTRGHLLLGVLGSGARNSYRILELGSRRGSVPSWLGG